MEHTPTHKIGFLGALTLKAFTWGFLWSFSQAEGLWASACRATVPYLTQSLVVSYMYFRFRDPADRANWMSKNVWNPADWLEHDFATQGGFVTLSDYRTHKSQIEAEQIATKKKAALKEFGSMIENVEHQAKEWVDSFVYKGNVLADLLAKRERLDGADRDEFTQIAAGLEWQLDVHDVPTVDEKYIIPLKVDPSDSLESVFGHIADNAFEAACRGSGQYDCLFEANYLRSLRAAQSWLPEFFSELAANMGVCLNEDAEVPGDMCQETTNPISKKLYCEFQIRLIEQAARELVTQKYLILKARVLTVLSIMAEAMNREEVQWFYEAARNRNWVSDSHEVMRVLFQEKKYLENFSGDPRLKLESVLCRLIREAAVSAFEEEANDGSPGARLLRSLKDIQAQLPVQFANFAKSRGMDLSEEALSSAEQGEADTWEEIQESQI